MAKPAYSERQYRKAVAQVLKRLRAEARITQEAAAFEAAIDRTHLSALEAGEHDAGAYTLARIANVYGLRLGALMTIIEDLALGYAAANAKRRKPREK